MEIPAGFPEQAESANPQRRGVSPYAFLSAYRGCARKVCTFRRRPNVGRKTRSAQQRIARSRRWGGVLIRSHGFPTLYPAGGCEAMMRSLASELMSQREMANSSGSDAVSRWGERRGTSVSEKELPYGSSRPATFSRTADSPTTSGVSAIRAGLSDEAHLFSGPGAGFQIKRKYEIRKVGGPRLSFMGCLLMFGADG